MYSQTIHDLDRLLTKYRLKTVTILVTMSQDGHMRINLNPEWPQTPRSRLRFFDLFVEYHNRNGNEYFILGTRDGITGERGFHRHGIQLPIITGVNIGSLKVSIRN